MKSQSIKIAVVDDHRLFRMGLINLLHSFGKSFEVVLEANNGQEFLELLKTKLPPDIVIIDVNMPVMDGFSTAVALQKEFPEVAVLIITMIEDENTLLRMLKSGVKGYLNKDIEPQELKTALESIANKGFYYTDYVTGKLIEAEQQPSQPKQKIHLKDREAKFLELACSDYSYQEIADIMCASVKTVDGYRNSLFEQFDVKSRVGMVMFALKNGLVHI